MPRVGRIKSKTGIYHIVIRGINRQNIFEEEEDSERFLATLKTAQEKSGYKLYAYCLMGNHIHLLIKEENEDLGITMRRIGASYVYWYNRKYDRHGHLFQGRYKSEVVEDDKYFLTVLRYIHQNPLKAGLVSDIEEYKWSSYREYLGRSRLVDTEFAMGIFGTNREKALRSFQEFHLIAKDDHCLDINYSRRVTDKLAIEIIKKKCRVNYCSEIQAMPQNKRDEYLKILKEEGLSTRQIARLTGISRGIVLKA